MGDVIGGITDAVGLTNRKGEKKAAQAAADANKAAVAMSKEQIDFSKEQLEFQKEQYADWEAVYGSLQQNLGDYYNSLDADELVTLGLENQQKECQAVETSIRRDAAQRGLKNSGLEYYEVNKAKVGNAIARASIRTSGDKMVAEEKLKFLGVGLGQGTALLGNVGSSANTVTSAYNSGINSRNNFGNSYINQSTQLGVQNMNSMGDLIGAGASIASAAIMASDRELKENIKKVGYEKGFNIYEFNYKGDKQKYKGVLAQEVIKVKPEAIVHTDNAILVDYDAIGLKMEKV